MSEQEHVPVWHAIVGDGWEPVRFGEETRRDDEVLSAGGWQPCREYGFLYKTEGMPRRRRKYWSGIQSWRIESDCWLIKGASPGDRFMLTGDSRLIPVGKPQVEGQVER